MALKSLCSRERPSEKRIVGQRKIAFDRAVAVGMGAKLGDPVVDYRPVFPIGQSAPVIDLHAIAIAAGQQLAHRATENLASQIPERDIDAADRRHVRLVGVLQSHHLVVEFIDIQRGGADEHATQPF